MNNFIVSARKYRPSTFKNVVAQQHITATLQNAIAQKKLAQAFLFCGPRGIGKTTCARILAKTINCEQVTSDIEACSACPTCTSFQSQRLFNIYELDAASNNSVDDIRNLVEQVRYAPQDSRYKIYIIDEVHMLSNAAFNAFLKTLEEPPSYAIFILATTEKHKIIPTILSRCQIFDFNRIQIHDVIAQLKYIAQKEAIEYEEQALYLIAKKSEGAMRDALSMFDVMVTFGKGKRIVYEDTRTYLHILDDAYYFKITQALFEKKISDVLLIYDKIFQQGFDGYQFLIGLSEHIRNLMICKDSDTIFLLSIPEVIQKKYIEHAKALPIEFLLKILQLTHQYTLQYKYSSHQRLHIEICLIDMCDALQKSSKIKDTTPASSVSITKSEAKTTKKNDTVPALSAVSTKSVTKIIKTNDTIIASESVLPKKVISSDNKSSIAIQQPVIWKTTTKIPQIENITQKMKDDISSDKVLYKEKKQQSFTKEALLLCWKDYLQKLKQEGKYTLYNTLKKNMPTAEGTHIIVKYSQSIQKSMLQDEKQNLITYLCNKLDNTFITIDLVEDDQHKTLKPYTAKEKFNFLLKKFPLIHILQQTLTLDIED